VPVRWFRGDGRQHLQHVVLHHVPHGAGPVVEPPAVRDVERLGHRDLDARHMRPVEQRFEHRVGEPGDQHVVQRVQPEPMVDPVDRLLGEDGVHGGVEFPRAAQIRAERLLHHHPGTLGPVRRRDTPCDAPEQRRRHLEVEQGPTTVAHLAGHRRVRRVVVEVAVDVAQQVEHPHRRRRPWIHSRARQRRGRVRPELIQVPAALRHPDDGHVEDAAVHEPDQRREGLEFGQVTCRAEDHQRVHPVAHQLPLVLGFNRAGRRGGRRRAAHWHHAHPVLTRDAGPHPEWTTVRATRRTAASRLGHRAGGWVPVGGSALTRLRRRVWRAIWVHWRPSWGGVRQAAERPGERARS
jgi:hypothetical protein